MAPILSTTSAGEVKRVIPECPAPPSITDDQGNEDDDSFHSMVAPPTDNRKPSRGWFWRESTSVRPTQAPIFLKNTENYEIDFLEDDPKDMTWGRRIALYMASRYKWYNRHKDGGDIDETLKDRGIQPPSLAKAWAYFEHVTLERYHTYGEDDSDKERVQEALREHFDNSNIGRTILDELNKGERRLDIAEPGEKTFPTKLYNPINTPLSQMGDFGLSYGIYFATLRYFAVLCFLVGLLNLPNMIYFASEEYDSTGKGDLRLILRGSAICTDTTWVPCIDCPENYEYAKVGFSRWAATTGRNISFAEDGEWVNVTEYTNLKGQTETLRRWELYYYDGVFNESTFAYFQEAFNVTVARKTLEEVDPYYITEKCDEGEFCIWERCECQILSFEDCYCKFGQDAPGATYNISRLGFAEKKNCDGATLRNGYINMASIFVFVFGAIWLRWHQNKLTVKFDEDEQTAQDYSICVQNPPEDACEPKEWKSFFESNFDCKVTVCTVDVDNDSFIRMLVRRRELVARMELLLPGIELTRENLHKEAKKDKDREGLFKKLFFRGSSVLKFFREYRNVEDAIIEKLKEKKGHRVTSVFVTFETERGKREVMKALSVGSYAAKRNDHSRVRDEKHLFRGELVLDVIEPEEPSAIRWQEINTPQSEALIRLLLTTFVSLGLIGVAFYIIVIAWKATPGFAPILTTICTSLFPMIAKALLPFERHHTESYRQRWLYFKIAVFNIIVATVLISVVTPFTATLDPRLGTLNSLIPSVHALLISQLGLTPAMQLMDIWGNINRHLLGPRAKTQGEMNRHFTGAQVYLAERYANMTKYLFLIVWYCAVYPPAFFLGSLALFIVYFADRFSLMRTWARAPQVDTPMANFARDYFTPSAIAFMAVLSAYAWSGFPYDNLCEVDDALDPSVFGLNWRLNERGTRESALGFQLFQAPDVDELFFVPEESRVYRYCLQDFRSYTGQSFPPLPRFQLDEWMTEEQEELLNVFCWVAVAVMAIVATVFVCRVAYNIYEGLFSSQKVRGKDMKKPFSREKTLDTYIPSYQPPFGYPFLLCDVSGIDAELFSWTDPDYPHSHYDLTCDVYSLVEESVEKSDIQKANFFAKVQHWHETDFMETIEIDFASTSESC